MCDDKNKMAAIELSSIISADIRDAFIKTKSPDFTPGVPTLIEISRSLHAIACVLTRVEKHLIQTDKPQDCSGNCPSP